MSPGVSACPQYGTRDWGPALPGDSYKPKPTSPIAISVAGKCEVVHTAVFMVPLYMLMRGNKPNGPRVEMKKASHARDVFRNRRLKAGFAAIAVSAAVTFFWTVGVMVRPLEATVQLERLTTKVEKTKFIPPETALAITRLVDQNGV